MNLKKEFRNYQIAINFIEYLLICLEAGEHIQSAFFLSIQQVDKSLFQKECLKVLKKYELGDSFNEALSNCAKKTESKLCQEIFDTIQTGLQLGTQLTKIIKEMSIQLRLQSKTYLEKLAHEAPIKMIFPLVIFIFPVLFTLLGTKTLLNFVQSLGV